MKKKHLLNTQRYRKIIDAHNIWKSIKKKQVTILKDVKAAEIKARLRTPTYILVFQAKRAKLIPKLLNPLCTIYEQEQEELENFINSYYEYSNGKLSGFYLVPFFGPTLNWCM